VNPAAASTADPAEIRKFDALAHGFWDPNGEFKPLHRLNPLRADFIAQHSSMKGAQVLDVGCGGGLLAESLAQRGAIVTAIDLSPAMIRTAQLHAATSDLAIDYRVQDVTDLAAAAPGKYDVVCCMEMLEHVANPAAFLGHLAALVKPDGAVYVSTLNRNAKAFLLAIVGAEYLMRLLPRGTHEYERFIKPSELAAWGRSCKLELTRTAGLHYDPFADRCRLSDDQSVNYMAQLQPLRPGQ
jgi:2-polyprenyl-6-hydroxyphenyl methylase / 3-demethylubiquinone-9 3-methyltransferase